MSTTAKARYEKLQDARRAVLDQAREAARLTIPGLIPEEGSSNPHDITEQPYSSVGARGVNNLSAKLLITMFPPERPFFRPDVDADTANDLGADLGEVQEALDGISRKAMVIVEASASRTTWMEVFRHLVVAGNGLVYHPDDGSKVRFWRLDQYVVKRSSDGKLLEAITHEEVYPSELDPSVRAAVGLDEPEEGENKKEAKVPLYTWIRRVEDRIEHFQEINGTEVPDSRSSALVEESGWQALRWQEVPGSDYGRSYVTEYAGDFLTLEDATASILRFAAAASRIITVLDPNSGIDAEEFASADSGDVLTGYRDRIGTLQLDKSQDFQTVWEVAQMIERRLSQAFLLTSNVVRDAERVTAEEIRAVASELEDSLGGTYTVLSAEVQKPYAQRLMHILVKKQQAPKLPPEINLVIVTGFSALGRNHEVAALRDYLTDLLNIFGPEWVAQNMDGQAIAMRLGVGRGVTDVKGLLRDPEQVQAEQQAQLQNEAALAGTPAIAKGVVDAMNNQENQIGNEEI